MDDFTHATEMLYKNIHIFILLMDKGKKSSELDETRKQEIILYRWSCASPETDLTNYITDYWVT